MNEALKKITEFHGHLGPYVVIGYRMGKIANKKLGNNPFSKKSIVYTGTTPPLSCIIDGIQISSGCTTGKGNLNIKEDFIPKAFFSNNEGEKIEICLLEPIRDEIDRIVNAKNMVSYSENLFEKTDKELFEIK